MLLIFKATNVKNPGSRGGHPWIDDKGHARYDERPTGERTHKYLAYLHLSDGTKKYIVPSDDELDASGQVIGGQPKIREIVNRELFGEYGFKQNGTFWQKKGILVEYKTRVTGRGKIEVDAIERHAGYTAFEFRDSSVARAYGGGLPKKITQYQVDAMPRDPVPSKDKIELPDAHDVPPIEELGIHTVPPRLPQTLVAVGEPLKDTEDPVAIATAYLGETFHAMKPSQAKTEAGQQRARDAREGQYDHVVGHRKIEALPLWAIAKFDSPEQLQQELSRGEGGRPLTTLITLGLWDKNIKQARVREQLLREWAPFLRRWVRRFASVYASTDSYRKFDKIEGGSSPTAQRDWLYDRERDLYNEGVAVLLDEANRYMSNDEPKGSDSRFDLKAGNAIKNHLERKAKNDALEFHGASIDDLSEEDAYHAPKTISPREHFELKHYEPRAMEILSEALLGLPIHKQEAFRSRLWIDDHHQSPDVSQERRFALARERQQQKRGESRVHWGRPLTRTKEGGVDSVADKLADTEVLLRNKRKKVRLGDLTPQHQRYYLEQWFNDAKAHVEEQLRTPSGRLSGDGVVVEKWLRLEEKLARVNYKELASRVQTIKMPLLNQSRLEHVRAEEHPAIAFFKEPKSNRQLAERLGIADDLDVPANLKHVSLPRQYETKLKRVAAYHRRLQDNLAYVGDLAPLHAQAHAVAERHRNMGSWYRTEHGTTEWHEEGGVTTLHDAAVKLHETKGNDAGAVTAFKDAANALGTDHPMVQDYVARLKLGAEKPTSNDLATWKTRSHSMYREHANRVHLIEFAQEHRETKKSLVDLRKALSAYIDAFDCLNEVLQ
jgi:hypothetical protein